MNAKITFVLGITAAAACFAGVAAVAAPETEEAPAPEIIREMDSLKLAYTPKPTPEPTAEPTTEPEAEPEVTEDPLPEFDSLVGTISPEAPAAEQPFTPGPEAPQVESVPPAEVEVTPMSYDEYVQSFINDGLSVGDVIVCENGWTVGIDEYEGGISWAACM